MIYQGLGSMKDQHQVSTLMYQQVVNVSIITYLITMAVLQITLLTQCLYFLKSVTRII